MKKIFEERAILTSKLSYNRCLYVRKGLFDQCLYKKQYDGTVLECKILETGFCRIGDYVHSSHLRYYVKYKTPLGEEMYVEDDYTTLNIFRTFEDAVRNENRMICYISSTSRDTSDFWCYDLSEMFDKEGFPKQCRRIVRDQIWQECYSYSEGKLLVNRVQFQLWCDSKGMHMNTIIPDGFHKTQEEAYAANMPKLICFESEEDIEPTPEQKKIMELEEVIENAKRELNKIKS